MVRKRKFNRIKRENPESRIWQRTREEQKVRNELAKTLIDARKRWVETPLDEYVIKKCEMRTAQNTLKAEERELEAEKGKLKAGKEELNAEKAKLKKEKELEKDRLKEEISQLNLSIDDRKKIIEKYKEIIWSEIDIKKLFEDDLSLIIDSISDYTLLWVIKKCIEEWWSVRVRLENKEKELEEKKKKIEEESQKILAEKRAKEEEERKEHLKENRKKRPLYDKDGNPIEVSDEKVKFLDMASNIEKYCKFKWINRIYFVGTVDYRDDNYNWTYCYNNLFDYAWFCQKEDGTMYYVDNCKTSVHNAKMEYYEDAKRFRENMFPNMKVKFLKWEFHSEKTRGWYNYRIECAFPRSKWALLMVEKYWAWNQSLFEKFKSYNWECIEYTWSWEFIAWKWIENFSDKKS